MSTSSNRGLTVGLVQRHAVVPAFDLLKTLNLTPYSGAVTWPVADRAYYIPTIIEETVTVKRMLAMIGATSSGQIDVGIYNETGNLQVSIDAGAGSPYGVAVGTVSQAQEFDIANTQLTPGRYYVGIVVDNTTAKIWHGSTGMNGTNALLGIKYEDSAMPLPATASFSESLTDNFIPVVGYTLEV